ncbi:MAG: hypothetical protein Q7V05_14860 [Methanoregula sp.]|nr:hypothetical protein [Methanoregula sp.]
MTAENRTDNAQTPSSGKRTAVKKTQQNESVASPNTATIFDPTAFFLRYALTLIIFLISLFFIITITNPALYMNDEWITANQLHQLNIGHQATFNEGKYGITEEGIVSAYFTSRQNVLMYSLALPISALPAVKLFGLFGDNFRLIVILSWSLCLVLIALLIEAYYPAYSKIRDRRILFPVLLLALFLFMFNILMYRQFIFSAPDAPFEVAALVLTSHIFFALTVAVVFETCKLIFKDRWMALLGTCATIACSSYIFWAGTAKDHMLTAAVFAFVIYFFVLHLTYGRWRDATISFICSGLLIWVRPEVGFFVTIFTGLFFCVPLIWQAIKKETSVSRSLKSCIPMLGVFIGGIPFFINNLLTSHNWLIPAFDLPRPMTEAGTLSKVPLPLSEVLAQEAVSGPAGGMNLFATLSRAWDMFTHAMFKGLSFDNIIHGFSGILMFPENGNIGFLIMCPIILLALVVFILWNKKILAGIKNQKEIFLFLFFMILAVVISYLPRLYSMNISHGVVPDMRYLSPAYLPCGILSIWVLSKTPFLKKPKELVTSGMIGAIIIVPVLILTMIVVHPFGSMNEGYFKFFEFIILCELILCLGLMFIHRFYRKENRFVPQAIPYLLVLLLIMVFTFQIVLVFIFGVIVKFNGYPLWIPLVENGFSTIFHVSIRPPV